MKLDIASKTTITVTMDDEYAVKLSGAVNRVLESANHLDRPRYEILVNTGTIDTLLSLKLGLVRELS